MEKILSVLMITILLMSVTACTAEVSIGRDDEPETVILTGELTEEESDELLSNSDFLPIGTVVTLENEEHKVMIIGVLQFESEDRSVLYDYSGVLYPEGLLDSKEDYLFNKEDIEEIHYLGYNSEEQEEIQKYIEEALEKYNDLESGK